MELLRRSCQELQQTVIVVTHDSRIFKFGDRIARMSDGRVLGVQHQAAGLPEEVIVL